MHFIKYRGGQFLLSPPPINLRLYSQEFFEFKHLSRIGLKDWKSSRLFNFIFVMWMYLAYVRRLSKIKPGYFNCLEIRYGFLAYIMYWLLEEEIVTVAKVGPLSLVPKIICSNILSKFYHLIIVISDFSVTKIIFLPSTCV